MIFNKNVKTTQWGKIVFSRNDGEKIAYPHAKKKKINLDFSLHHIQKLTQNGLKT